mgnify:CR=1 FL=1
MGQKILKPALAKFMHQYPELKVQLNLVNRRVDFIEEGYDVLIRIGQLDDSMLIAKKLGTISRKLFASPSYIAKNGLPQSASDLVNHQLLVMNPVNNEIKLPLISQQGEQFTLQCKPRLLVDDFALLKQSIIDGLGIAVLPEYMGKGEIESGQLVKVLPDWGLEDVDVFALYPRNRVKIPKIKALLDFISELYLEALS